MSKSIIKYGQCSHVLFSAAVEILEEVTGARWGFVQLRRKVSYVTSETIKIKLGNGKNADYTIKTRPGTSDWKQSLKFELCLALAEFAKKNPSARINLTAVGHIGTKTIGLKIADCIEETVIDLSACREINKYQSTFIHASTDWIAKEAIILEQHKHISREDYM